ncbi:metallophosphoesterase [Myxococcus stipitatus]|uniref:metallophosphoesterase family protein n=1 Tax=Myxococcus stipitatus TaxID=83455 RepID=UPI00314522E1
MRILTLDESPSQRWPYLEAAPRGGTRTAWFPLLRGTVDVLPDDVAALLVLSDLQGVAPHRVFDGEMTLLGEMLADEVALLGELGELPPPGSVGVVLAGDLYSAPGANVRGASGDVRSVWQSFARYFRWVVGVAGNHDSFGGPREQTRFQQRPGIHLLDGEVVELEGLRFGGVGSIIGNSDKPGRREEAAQLGLLRDTLRARPELLVLHQGPNVEGTDLRGSPLIRECVQKCTGLLVICGHAHWESPLATLTSGVQVLNVDSRAVLLERRLPSA